MDKTISRFGNRNLNKDEQLTEKVTMWNCSCCGILITHYDEIEKEVYADIHFDVERSNKVMYVDDDGDNCIIEENLANRNVKMNRQICENCFNKILNESPTLRKTFECKIDGEINIIY